MSKTEKFVEEINKVASDFNFSKLTKREYRNEVGTKLVDAFEKAYGHSFVSSDLCVEDDGFAIVPSLLKAGDGTEFLALMHICVQDSGENYGAELLHPKYGFVHQEEFKKKMSEAEVKGMYPYKYRPLVNIVGDIHSADYF